MAGLFDIVPFTDKNSERYMLSKRIGKAAAELEKRYTTVFSEPTGDFVLRDGQHSIGELQLGEWVPFCADRDFWGYPECYCWFRQSIDIPNQFKGLSVYYNVFPVDDRWNTNPQLILFVNSKSFQGMDSNHPGARLIAPAKGGEHYEIAINAHMDPHRYTGQARMRAKLTAVDEDIKKLVRHLRTPLEVANLYGADDMARVHIINQLNEAVNLIRFDLPYGTEFKKSAALAADYIENNVFGKGGSEYISAIGHTHIDVAYRWRIRQTRDKAARSFSTVLRLMDENPGFRFMSSQAQLYDFVKKDYPEVYERIKKRVRDGHWEPEGGMWVEADTNIPCGESLIRQFLVGKRFFKKEFDKDCKILWLPDVFGYSAALPQIMKKCGIRYFVTTKISWNEYTVFPYDTFKWRGIDGTEILSHFIPTSEYDARQNGELETDYNGVLAPSSVMGAWRNYKHKELNNNILFTYGYGDGGGGPTQEMFESGLRMHAGIEGCPGVKFEFAGDFFRKLEQDVKNSRRLNTYSGELYLEFHRGTYTSQAINKQMNRKSEILYHDIECAGVLAAAVADNSFENYPKTGLDCGWETILLNQFHDIIPGSAIKEVYEDSKKQYDTILNEGKYMLSGALEKTAARIKSESRVAVVFNTCGFERDDIVICEPPADSDFSITDSNGIKLAVQETFDNKICFFARNIPATGYKTFFITPISEPVRKTAATVTGNRVKSRFFDLDFNDKMEIVSLIHKKSGRNVIPKGFAGNRLIAYEDMPYKYDAWNINAYYTEKSYAVDEVLNARVIESGPVRTVLMTVRKFRSSIITQYIILYSDIERIDIENEIDWRENNILLRVDFPVDVNTGKATFDIQFGNIERNTHSNTVADFAQFEVPAQKWADMSDNSFGFSLLNDSKYGYSAKDGHLGLSLLRSQNSPTENQDKGLHHFTYSLYPHEGFVTQADTVSQAYSLNFPLHCVCTLPHGTLNEEFSLFSVDKNNIIIEAVKKAEDSNAVIVRMYETWNRKTTASLTVGRHIARASECDMLEENDMPVNTMNDVIDLEFKPFEIKTIKILFR